MIHQVIYMNDFKVLRAEKTWQRAGAYSVRIQGMNRQHHIALQDEFDEHDGDESKYIVLLDDEYPVATCRLCPPRKNRQKIHAKNRMKRMTNMI